MGNLAVFPMMKTSHNFRFRKHQISTSHRCNLKYQAVKPKSKATSPLKGEEGKHATKGVTHFRVRSAIENLSHKLLVRF